MKKGLIVGVLILLFGLEIAICILAINRVGAIKQDTIKINEIVKTIEKNYNDESKYITDLE